MFKGPQVFSSVPHEEGGPSGQKKVQETETVGVLVFVTYERGTRKFFAATRRVLSPQGVEGSHLHLQVAGKCYLHKEWKGICLHLQLNRYRFGNNTRATIKEIKKCMRMILRMGKREILTLLIMGRHKELMSLIRKLEVQ